MSQKPVSAGVLEGTKSVFICFADKKDAVLAQQLSAALEDNGQKVEGSDSSASGNKARETLIPKCKALICIATKAFDKSGKAKKEVTTAHKATVPLITIMSEDKHHMKAAWYISAAGGSPVIDFSNDAAFDGKLAELKLRLSVDGARDSTSPADSGNNIDIVGTISTRAASVVGSVASDSGSVSSKLSHKSSTSAFNSAADVPDVLDRLKNSSDVITAAKHFRQLMTLGLVADAAESIASMGGIELILQTMTTHKSADELQLYGCCIFAHVACCAPTTRQAIVKAGACKIITDAMVAHTKKDGVQQYGCTALEYLASECDTSVSGAVDAAEKAIFHSASNADFVFRGLRMMYAFLVSPKLAADDRTTIVKKLPKLCDLVASKFGDSSAVASLATELKKMIV